MLRPIDRYFLQKGEPIKSCLEYLRELIQQQHPGITENWRYGMPFYYYKGRMFCYLWVHKKYRQPYLGIVEGRKMKHPELLSEKRSRMKILLIDPSKNIPLRKIKAILKEAMSLY